MDHIEADFLGVSAGCDGFSEEKMQDFFAKPTLAFMFAWFSKHPEGKKFARDKFREQNKVDGYVEEMMRGIKKFGAKAEATLVEMREENGCRLSKNLLIYLNNADFSTNQ